MKCISVTPDEFVTKLINCADCTRVVTTIDDERIMLLDPIMKFQIHNLAKLCEGLNIDYNIEDWDGNEHCNSNYDIMWFERNGIKFFELIDRGDELDDNN